MPEAYLAWNNAIAARIFRPEMAGRQVFLYVNDDLIEEIGGEGSVPAFVAAVEAGPPWVPAHLGLCQKALRTLEGWRERELEFPPYIGYLGLFVLAVGVDGPFAPHAYYPRLRTLLGWSDVDAGAPPSFDRMLQLWEDLEVWSNQDTGGALGVSSIRIAGEWIHVGLPKAQAVLIEQELHALPSIFAAAEFDPTAPPSDRELARALRRHGGQLLRSPTLDLLASPGTEPELLAVLLDTVRNELEEWDGEIQPSADGQERTITALARVCLRVDEIAGRVTATLRVAANAEFPEDGLFLSTRDRARQLTCREYLPGWSSALQEATTGGELDASELSWTEPLLLRDQSAGWQVRLPPARVRIFVTGLPFDLPGHVEVRRLPANKPFMLAASAQASPAIERWNESGEVELQQLNILNGLPENWTLHRSSGARSDTAVRDALPELALPAAVRVTLKGGIRSEQGTSFFKFAPPVVVVDGGEGTEEVLCEGIRLTPIEETGFFPLPEDLPAGARITVEVRAGADVVRRQSLFLSDEFEWRLRDRLASLDRFGLAEAARPGSDQEEPRVSGASGVPGIEFGALPVRPALPADRRVFAIGRQAGQIRRLPVEPFPIDWDPVWLVELERKGRAEYCGRDLGSANPIDAPAGTSDEIALWKEVLWRRRKRIAPPQHPALRKLWAVYIEAGSRV
ncbi:MAG TPA: hypothetical protein VFL61_09020 [Gaiellaceae bacterium]|nr:hypothetical protein [Gaiellaceae bacterium]